MVKIFIYQAINKLHYFLYKKPIGLEMEAFLRNLSWSFVGGLIASAIGMVGSIYVSRHLHLDQLGKYNSIVSFSTALSSLILFGSHISGLRFSCDQEHLPQQPKIISAAFLITAINSLVVLLIFFITSPLLPPSSPYKYLFPISYILANLISIKALLDMVLRTLQNLSKQSLLRILDSVTVFATGLVLIGISKQTNYFSPYISLLLGISVFIIFGLYFSQHKFSKPNYTSIKKVFKFNTSLILFIIGNFLISSEGLFIGKYIGFESLGIYSVLSIGTFVTIANLGSIFLNAYNPALIKNKQHLHSILLKTTKIFFWGIFLWLPTSMVLSFIVLQITHQQIPLAFIRTFNLAFNSYIVVFFSTLTGMLQILNSHKASLISFLCYVSIILSIVLLHTLDLFFISQGIIYLIFSTILFVQIKRYVIQN